MDRWHSAKSASQGTWSLAMSWSWRAWHSGFIKIPPCKDEKRVLPKVSSCALEITSRAGRAALGPAATPTHGRQDQRRTAAAHRPHGGSSIQERECGSRPRESRTLSIRRDENAARHRIDDHKEGGEDTRSSQCPDSGHHNQFSQENRTRHKVVLGVTTSRLAAKTTALKPRDN